MKRIVILGVLPLALGLAVGVSLKGSQHKEIEPTPIARAHASPDLSRFEPINKDLPTEFNIFLPVQERPQKLSVALNVQDQQNYYLLELLPQVRISKVENGLLLPLTTAETSAQLPRSFDIMIKRRRRDLIVVVNGTICAAAYDGSFHRGAAVISTYSGLNTQGVKVQAVGDIYFADDFMKGADAGSHWDEVSGNWNVNTLKNSGMSSNAFFYTGRARGEASALSTAGYWFWDNYTFAASCRAEGSEYVGLCFYYRDPGNYFLFRWSLDSAGGRKQLVKVANGTMSVLAEEPGGYSIKQWYTMEVRINRRMVKALIDGNLVFTASDDALAYGKVGLYNEGGEAARFDDVFVRNDKSLFDCFPSRSAGAWQQLGGKWQIRPDDPAEPDGDNVLRAQVSEAGKAMTGDDYCRNYAFTVAVKGWEHGDVGLATHYLDEANHYLYTVSSNGTHRLLRYARGVRTVLAEKTMPMQPNRPHELFFSADDNILTAGIDGRGCFEEWDETIKSGRAGLYASNVGTVDFDNVGLAMKRQGEEVLTTNQIFAEEKTMAGWASKLRDWLPKSKTINGRRYDVSRHRADFPGDVEISAKLGPMPSGNGDIRLAICTNGRGLDSGYTMSIRNRRGLQVELFRAGRSVAQQSVQADAPIRVSLKRKGSFVIGLVNFEPVIRFKDKAPLNGTTVGIAHPKDAQVAKENIQVFCPNVHSYTFAKASSDWRVASGRWEVTSRWECDDRWSFFSGVSKKNATLWCKRRLKGDVTLEFAAGIKMDRSRGNSYEYASDINATICADGEDLTSGYSFMFGGWNNTSTRIMRGNTVVAESKTSLIPNKQNIHRRWFYIKIRKQGSKLQYYIDNQLVLEFNDPQPLTGNRLALWTHHNGIMVAKVRMSCSDGEERESPDFKPQGTPKSPYTAGR